MKPSRSDEIQSPEAEQRRAKEVQAHFELMAPKRPIKPARSEPSSNAGGAIAAADAPADQQIPEHAKLLDLEVRSEPLITRGGLVGDESYAENEYYKDLIAAENGQHHTTGTGFIDAGAAQGSSFQLVDDYGNAPFSSNSVKSNPATNDWVPAPGLAPSTKPRRRSD
ncbi:uncharacterized protein LOC9635979 [Selaginella moellendorffii]|uniref:uncharacterized protein LOC9635979 n=1 Tax=Selaginella moellendorffii TaxID=88036 RepID=UPI000D1CEDC3|nr:uncharacterized protein LOC9635979 [Selaginella moellendorffii]|eukprot:XP_002965565.2 uncharacterized protein LOC9635979 [Selaginella moellendorffii]